MNKQRTGTILALIGVAVLILAVLLGNRNAERVQTENTAVLEDTTRNISFSWWGNDTRHAYTLKGLELFQEKYPDIAVSHRYGVWNGYEKRMKVSMKSNTECDVMQINYAWLQQYSPDGTGFYDLYQLSAYIDFSNFTEEDLAYGEVNGKLNAIPIAYNMPTFFYNQDVYAQYGLEIPTTWDDLFEAAAVMREDGVYPLGMIRKHLWFMLLAYYEQSTGNAAFSDDGQLQIDAEGFELMMTFYRRLVEEKVIMPVNDFSEQYFNENVAGVLIWISDADRYCNELVDSGVSVAVGESLTMENAQRYGWYIKPATMYAISDITEEPEAAAQLLNFLLNDPDMTLLQGTEKGIPVSIRAVETLQENDALESIEQEATKRMNAKKEELNAIMPAMEDEDILAVFKTESDAYIFDQKDPDACAEDFVAEVQALQDAD